MKEYNFLKMQKRLCKYMDEDRFVHTMGVMYTSCALAMRYGINMEKARVAGLLHDSAKCMPNSKKLKICKRENIPVTDVEMENPFLLHAKLGVYIAREKYGVEDREILQAIRYHNTGRPEMTLLEKIIYIADYIEPNRDKAPNLPQVRRLAFVDLDESMYVILRDTLSYLEEGGGSIDRTTEKAYAFYKKIHERKESENG
ncbi:MAG TPA: bis(5'-nucleosyl)-tetraphosphatase (symmetrical) YqeK [Candidatus Limivivens intestinipullorum]|uniref:bis(5'-nucleosyl)-tetraphosphatase (symmetrical) n=1 Tax=Candidatus Limivivens intestinipullorum TaxID=2840858 RepID=A0A9D1ET44_9FIRM|nr:bis(5'-nucleosyl)-tetraphosphatase (symmetrical) YqeK [Candidatus Limivivens intestinipullorum]